MRAHLARHVSRRHLAHIARCPLARASRPRPTCHFYNALIGVPRPFRRTFFGIFKEAPRRIKSPEWEPGWPLVMAWRSRTLEDLRPPPRAELSEAFGKLFEHKLQHQIPVNSTQALQCLRLFNYLVENKDDEEGPGLSITELTAARDALLLVPGDSAKHHLEFSRALYGEIQHQRCLEAEYGMPEDMSEEAAVEGPQKPPKETPAETDFRCHLTALTYYGASTEATTALNERWAKISAEDRLHSRYKKLWMVLLQGLAREGKETELLEQARIAEEHGAEYLPLFQQVMTTFFAKQDRVAETKYWFERDMGNQWPSGPTYSAIIRFAARNGEVEWVGAHFRRLIDANLRRPPWDIILQWAVICRGEGVEGVRHMIDIMTKNNAKNNHRKEYVRPPNMNNINALIRTAIERNDQYLAERFMALATELDLRPNPTTYALQMDYRISAKDFSGARAAYQELQRAEVTHDEDLPVINKYIRALCAAPQPLLDDIYRVTADLEHRIVTLEPETVVALCLTLLQNEDQYEVIDTLAVHVFHYSSEQREQIRDAFLGFILDRRNSTSRVWDAYQLVKQFFSETPRESRTEVMDSFFDRRRADMAASVFVHMKEHASSDVRPGVDDYVRALEGLGRCPDPESLDALHNMLKLDTNIQPSTRLYNALMLAFGACGRSRRALDYWHEVAHSREGPSYASLEIIFAVLEKRPFGDDDARRIWRNVERMELEVPPAVFASYCGALAGNGRLDDLKVLLKDMARSVGYGPDVMTLGIIYNALPGRKLQADFQAWALGLYPDLWLELEKKGRRGTDDTGINFRISRELRA